LGEDSLKKVTLIFEELANLDLREVALRVRSTQDYEPRSLV
jgi:hypothetical protein